MADGTGPDADFLGFGDANLLVHFVDEPEGGEGHEDDDSEDDEFDSLVGHGVSVLWINAAGDILLRGG